MTVTTIGSRSSLMVQNLVNLRAELDRLQQQLGSGQKSTDYAGLGTDRGLSVALRSQLAALDAYNGAIAQVGIRLDIAQQTLGRIATIGSSVKTSALTSAFNLNGNGQTTDQTTAASNLDELFSLFNTQAGNRYLFSGKATDLPAVETTDHILDGDGQRAGFKQVAAERLEADLGGDGLGRLTIGRAGATVSIAEDTANSPFGFKIVGLTTTVQGAHINAPAGAPPSGSISFAGSSPAAGQTVTLQLSLPDGSSETLTLTATTNAPPGPNQFTVGAGAGATASNLATAVKTALATLGKTALRPASAMAVATDFFDVDDGRPPQRVAGPPFATATALTDGTADDTVTWYTGEGGPDPARTTATARIDPSMSVAYGLRANESAFRTTVEAVAAFAATTFSSTDADASATYSALQQRVATALAGAPGEQRVSDIEAELGGAQAALGAAKDRHTQTAATLQDMLGGITGVSEEEVGAKILALQTSLQASLQTTAMMYQTTILDYL
ncbi:MAG TPA: hypothetical protein VFQ90_06790 [Stellaceae bacterium]|nr:hypothetical protein [Stellaceae bacterium]